MESFGTNGNSNTYHQFMQIEEHLFVLDFPSEIKTCDEFYILKSKCNTSYEFKKKENRKTFVEH